MNTFRPFLLCAALLLNAAPAVLPLAPAVAQSGSPAPFAATATQAWATGLKSPQGLARSTDGKVFVAEAGAGRVTGFGADGAKLGTIGEGLQSPSSVVWGRDRLFVAERNGRVLRLEPDGTLAPLPTTVEGVSALAALPGTDFLIAVAPAKLVIVAGTLSATDNAAGDVLYAAPKEGKKPAFRAAITDRDGSFYIADEKGGNVWLLTPRGRLARWANGLDGPSALAMAPDGTVYVAEAGAGRVVKLSAEGRATSVASGLGEPRGLLMLDTHTLLVSDAKSGTLWKVALP